ncbi:hypothetical protein [Bradyrhizobium sp. CSS354]|uniref:hypothetical protein n=1 Tax=Bradyrhizobium sp. CSS354 TaxID=2699172 RepID=UPI0023B1986B|nr:hypothetical protein [Bradyrhizobium sp. CSS354]MDE5466365.1 hypothetical protein [Bradyrhizobium sp. CSS354]
MVRRWYEEDMAAGCEFVFHKSNGGRYRGPKLGWQTFKWIVRDAGIVGRRIPHHLKDLGMEWAEAARLRLEAFAKHADTSAGKLSGTYGDALRSALLQEAAEGMTQVNWRADGARRAAIADRFRSGGASRSEAPRPERQAEGRHVGAARQVKTAGKRATAAGKRA